MKKDFFQAIGNVFGGTNQHASQINYNINMFSSGMESINALPREMTLQNAFKSETMREFEIQPNRLRVD